jgi:hypothetical protein
MPASAGTSSHTHMEGLFAASGPPARTSPRTGCRAGPRAGPPPGPAQPARPRRRGQGGPALLPGEYRRHFARLSGSGRTRPVPLSRCVKSSGQAFFIGQKYRGLSWFAPAWRPGKTQFPVGSGQSSVTARDAVPGPITPAPASFRSNTSEWPGQRRQAVIATFDKNHLSLRRNGLSGMVLKVLIARVSQRFRIELVTCAAANTCCSLRQWQA